MRQLLEINSKPLSREITKKKIVECLESQTKPCITSSCFPLILFLVNYLHNKFPLQIDNDLQMGSNRRRRRRPSPALRQQCHACTKKERNEKTIVNRFFLYLAQFPEGMCSTIHSNSYSSILSGRYAKSHPVVGKS